MKILKWIVMILGVVGILLGAMAWMGGSDFMTFAEFAIFGVVLIAYGRMIGKPKPAGQKKESSDNDWGSALDRD